MVGTWASLAPKTIAQTPQNNKRTTKQQQQQWIIQSYWQFKKRKERRTSISLAVLSTGLWSVARYSRSHILTDISWSHRYTGRTHGAEPSRFQTPHTRWCRRTGWGLSYAARPCSALLWPAGPAASPPPETYDMSVTWYSTPSQPPESQAYQVIKSRSQVKSHNTSYLKITGNK